HRDRRLLVWTQEICPRSPRARAQLLKGTFPIRKPEGPWESPDPHTVRGHVLGPLVSEFFFVGCASGQDGSAPLRQGVAPGPDSNSQPRLRAGDAAAVFLCHLSRCQQMGPRDAAPKIRRWTLYGDRRVPDCRMDSNTPRCRGPSEYHLADSRFPCTDGWRGDGFCDAPGV